MLIALWGRPLNPKSAYKYRNLPEKCREKNCTATTVCKYRQKSIYMDSDSYEENYYSDGDETVDDQSNQSEV